MNLNSIDLISNFQGDDWSPALTVHSICISVLSMLSSATVKVWKTWSLLIFIHSFIQNKIFEIYRSYLWTIPAIQVDLTQIRRGLASITTTTKCSGQQRNCPYSHSSLIQSDCPNKHLHAKMLRMISTMRRNLCTHNLKVAIFTMSVT